MDELEKIDTIRQRLNISYRDAKAALDLHNGDVLAALIDLEEKNSVEDVLAQAGHGLAGKFKQMVKAGGKTKIKVMKEDQTVFQFPASLGALGLVGALASTELAVVGILGTASLMAKKYSLALDQNQNQANEPAGTNQE